MYNKLCYFFTNNISPYKENLLSNTKKDIKSLHFSKFADKDAEGNDILPALLDNLGVDSTPCGLSNLRRLTDTELTSRSSCGSRLSRTIPRPSLSAQRS